MGAKITLMGSEWISLDGSLPEVQNHVISWIERMCFVG